MSNHDSSPQLLEASRAAGRLLAIPVMAFALLIAYMLLRAPSDDPALIADVAPALLVAPEEASLPPAELRAPPRRDEAAFRDAAIVAHETLDPVGAGRAP